MLPIALAADPDLHVDMVVIGHEAVVARARTTRPDIVLLSSALPDTDVAGLISDLLAAVPDTKIIVLSESYEEAVLFACVRAGAVGSLTWQQSRDELIHAIRRAHAGETLIDSHVLLRLLQSSRQDVPRSNPPPELAPREIDVLQYAMAGLRNKAIARQLGISVHTVRAHLQNAMAKLHVHSKLEAAIVALRAGLIEFPE